jgi:hypothetical protein
MIDFKVKNDLVVLIYYPTNHWVIEAFEKKKEVTIKKSFIFLRADLDLQDTDEDNGISAFILGRLVGNYFEIEGRMLGIEHSLFINKNIKISKSFFIAKSNVSVFRKINRLIDGDFYIGGDNENAFPEKEFRRLIKDFPNSYEVEKYVDARIGSILSNYFESASDSEEKYNRYLNKRKSKKGDNVYDNLKEGELIKYEIILSKLENMLANEGLYNERQWQTEILQIILLLYPKYIRVFEKVRIKHAYKKTYKELDFLLIDSNGSVDIIEIKRSSAKKIITERTYRDNYIPYGELSGAVMQIEKYIFHLNKWGKKGEDKLTEKYKKELPKKFKIKITNPSGLIIMGRDVGLSPAQKDDFEVIKRKYKNIIDIITYDDLLKRLNFIIGAFAIIK